MTNYNYKIIGRCSICGGNVIIYSGPWMSVIPPQPFCQECGATIKKPIIEMEPPRRYTDHLGYKSNPDHRYDIRYYYGY